MCDLQGQDQCSQSRHHSSALFSSHQHCSWLAGSVEAAAMSSVVPVQSEFPYSLFVKLFISTEIWSGFFLQIAARSTGSVPAAPLQPHHRPVALTDPLTHSLRHMLIPPTSGSFVLSLSSSISSPWLALSSSSIFILFSSYYSRTTTMSSMSRE